MEIQINNKPHKIKFASQLTACEYIKYMDMLTDESGAFEQLIYYISVVTNTDISDVSNINIDDDSIRRLSAYIGVVPQVNEFPELDSFYYGRKGRTIYKNSLNWRTLGARKMLEEKKLDSHLEQAVYLLAVYVSGDYDSEKIEAIYNELLDYEAAKVFGFIVFFFKKLVNGTKSGKSSLLMRIIKAFINIRRSSKKLQEID